MNGSAPLATRLALRRIEEASLNALQTQRQLFYDGWLLRLSPGVARRGRSINAHFGSSLPLERKFAYCEAVYERHALPVLFRLTPFDAPSNLDAALEARGYRKFGETLVQTLEMDRPPELPEYADDVDLETIEAPAFVDAVSELRRATLDQREAHLERLAHSPLAKRHAVVRARGRIVCAGQIAVEDDVAGVFDVVTAGDARKQGYATLACAWLLSWAWQNGTHVAYLQVSADNVAALRVYEKFGFTSAYGYHYRGRPGESDE